MSEFTEILKTEATHTYTENGARALNTTGSALVDLFSTIGALRDTWEQRIYSLYEAAYAEDPLLATRILFYGRDCREGLGERDVFRLLLHYAAQHHPLSIIPNIPLIGMYGRYDDLYALMDTTLESAMWKYMREQLDQDYQAMQEGKPVSLLAKWVKTADSASEKTRKLGILTALKLGLSVREYKRRYKDLRRYIDIPERKMSQNRWSSIDYEKVPAYAMLKYRWAFSWRDRKRFIDYLHKVRIGEATIHTGVLYPYDLVGKYLDNETLADQEDESVETLWANLPDYVNKGTNALVIADTSGSMFWDGGRPIKTALGLAIYFAERNTGAFHNLFMEFSSESRIHQLKGASLCQKISNVMDDCFWGGSTNLAGALARIVCIARENRISPDEMPKSLIVISDMEIDQCENSDWNFYEGFRKYYNRFGYEMPQLIFWNVDSRHDTFLADANRKGVLLVSGNSPTTFLQVLDQINLSGYELMKKVLGSERYAPVTIYPDSVKNAG